MLEETAAVLAMSGATDPRAAGSPSRTGRPAARRALVAAVSRELAPGGRYGAQNNTAREQGQVNAAMFGNGVAHSTAAPGAVPRPRTRADEHAESEDSGGAP